MRRFMSEENVRYRDGDEGRIRSTNGQSSHSSIVYFAGDGGLRLVGERRGSVDAQAVLLLHGGGQTRHAWAGAAERLAKAGFCSITLDMRGHGESGWSPNGEYSLDALSADVHCVIDQVGGTPALVGASMGGIAALIAVGEGLVPAASKLVLVDIAPRVERAGVQRIIAFMSARPDGFASLEEVRDAIAAYNPHRPPPKDLGGLKKNLRLSDDGRYRWHWDPSFLGEAAKREAGGEFPDLERRLAAARGIRIPTLLVRGAGSDVVSAEGARELRELIPHALAVDIADAGHMVAGDRNDVFADAVLGFLNTP